MDNFLSENQLYGFMYEEQLISIIRTKYGWWKKFWNSSFIGIKIPIVEGGVGESQKVILIKEVSAIHDIKKGVGESHTLSFALKLGHTKSVVIQAEYIYLLFIRGFDVR